MNGDMSGVKARAYQPEDIEQIVDIVVRELPGLPNYRDVVPARDRIHYLMANNLTNAQFMCTVLVTSDEQVVGGIAGYCTPAMFSWETVAQDVFLWIDPQHRSLLNAEALIKAYTNWAKARNAKIITGSFTSGYEPALMDKMLRRIGFEYVGNLYHLKGE